MYSKNHQVIWRHTGPSALLRINSSWYPDLSEFLDSGSRYRGLDPGLPGMTMLEEK
jgi:hypothetical protein